MHAVLMLADFAQAVEGKLFINGGGWSVTGPGPVLMGVAIKIEVPWDQGNQQHHFVLELVTQDGQPVTVPGPAGDQEIRIEGDFETGRPAGLKPGTPLDVALAVNIGPLPLAPDNRFTWTLSIDEHAEEGWRASFTTRPAPQAQAAGMAGGA